MAFHLFHSTTCLNLGLLILLVTLSNCSTTPPPSDTDGYTWDMSVENHTGKPKNLHQLDGKHRGMSAFRWRENHFESINQLVKNNIECVAVIPFFYQQTDTTRVMRTPEKVGEWSRRDSSFLNTIDSLHDRGLQVMLKPHLWMREGWRSNIRFENEEDWNMWFDSYRLNALHYAHMAKEKDVALFCIGTEFNSSIRQQPQKWHELILEIKQIYQGKLTYAANWDSEYKFVSFWGDMDYIGIQAYYPLTKNENPNLKEIKKGWSKHVRTLKRLHRKYNKPILFTEVGYRSEPTATIKPWEWDSSPEVRDNPPSNVTQQLAYEALFQKLWNKDWFAGMYFWQWHNDHEPRRKDNIDFTPRYKPAENVLAKWYGKQ